MHILPVNYSFKIQQTKTLKTENSPTQIRISNPLSVDTVCFRGIQSSGGSLKSLTRYGVYDMYTGLRLIDPKYLERLLQKSFFSKPLSEVLPVLEKQRDALNKTDNAILDEFQKVGKNNPNLRIDEAIKILKPEHEKKLLKAQQPIFEELTEKACDLPDKIYTEFLELMKITQKRISREPVVMPFSAKEFIYKLQRVKEEIVGKNNPREIKAINNLIRSANLLFENQIIPKNTLGRRKMNRAEKLKNQMEKEVLKNNSIKFKCIREIFEDSTLKHNSELRHIFKTTSAKIHGFPIVAPFKAKEFTHDLKNVLKPLKDRKLAGEMIEIAHRLPSSLENVSAFIVKYADDTPGKIGFSLLKNSVHSIEHILPKTLGGENSLKNYGLCGVYINSKRTNTPFADWCKIHPQAAVNCQKYLDRMIELYKDGTFAKVGLTKQYLYDFVERVQKLSSKKNQIVLDLSKLEH